MTPNEYQQLALRTECNQEVSRVRMSGWTPDEDDGEVARIPIRLNHSVIGIAGEVGELAAAVEKWIYYSRPLDIDNLVEEYGDMLWYIAEGLNAIGVSLEDVMIKNIRKLRARYPEQYTDEKEENRDREAERRAMLAAPETEGGSGPGEGEGIA